MKRLTLTLLLMLWAGVAQGVTTNLIFDTDYGDRDDGCVISYLNYALDNPGTYDLNLLCIGCDERTSTSSGSNAAGVSACQYYYGRKNTRIGKNKTGLSGTDGFLSSYLFPRKAVRIENCEEVIAMYREILAAQPDGSVTICTAGWMNNIADLLASSADGFSGLNGVQLVAAKVNRIVIMGGRFPTNVIPEANFANSAADSNYVCANWPSTVPMYFCGYEVGGTIWPDAGDFTAMPADNPVKEKVAITGTDGAWDTCALMEVLEPGASNWYTYTRGTNTVNASTGANTFTNSGSGPHYYLVKNQTDATFKAFLAPKMTYSRTQSYSRTPIDRWNFAEGTGSTSTSVGGTAATLAGTALLSANPGTLRCANTGNGYARISPPVDAVRYFPKRSITYICEFTTRTLVGTQAEIIYGGDRSAGAGGWWSLGIDQTTPTWTVSFNGGNDIQGGLAASSTKYRTAVVVDGLGLTAKLFVNGAQVGSTFNTSSDALGASYGNWDFGGRATSSDTARNANIDVEFWESRPGVAVPLEVYGGAAGGASGQASSAFTVSMPLGAASGNTITMTTSGGTITATASGATISNNGTGTVQVTLPAGLYEFTFTFTPSSGGTKTIAFTNGQSWANPSDVSYAATSKSIPPFLLQSISKTPIRQQYSEPHYANAP